MLRRRTPQVPIGTALVGLGTIVALALGTLASPVSAEAVGVNDSIANTEEGEVRADDVDADSGQAPWQPPAQIPDRCVAPPVYEQPEATPSPTPEASDSASATLPVTASPTSSPEEDSADETGPPTSSPSPSSEEELSSPPQASASPSSSESAEISLDGRSASAEEPSEESASEAGSSAEIAVSPTPEASEESASDSPSDSPSESESSAEIAISPTPEASEGSASDSPSDSPSESPAPQDSESPSESVSPAWVCPGSVTDVTVEADVNAIQVRWNPSSSGDAAEAFYVTVVGPEGFSKVQPVEAPATDVVVAGLKNGVGYQVSVTAATRNGSAAPSEPVSATPSTGMEGVVAGVVVEFQPGKERSIGERNVPGESRIGEVDLTVSQRVTDETVLLEMSEPVDRATAENIAATLSAESDVAWAEPDEFFFTASESTDQELVGPVAVPSDSEYVASQWNLWDSYGVGVGNGPDAMTSGWAQTRGEGVTVAVIDTGITSHPDLDAQLVPGYDFVSSPAKLAAVRASAGQAVPFDGDYIDEGAFGSLGRDTNPTDPGDWRGVAPARDSSWHGSKIAGVIAAQSNDQGVAGIAPDAKIQPVRALSWRGGLLSDIAASITWASGGVVDGAPVNSSPSRIINMSFAVETMCPNTLQNAIDGAIERGALLVAAAGNASDDAGKFAPGNCNGVLTVGATNRDGVRADYSNFGPVVDVSAPGGDSLNPIRTTSNDGATTAVIASTGADQGTSVAAAHVSGAAAVLASRQATMTSMQIFEALTGEVYTRDFGNPTCDVSDAAISCGAGIVQIASTGPVVTGVSPDSGTAAGGTTVTITGTGFTDATDVTFGGESGTSLTVDSDTQITVTTPVRNGSDRKVGPKQVVVTGPSGSSTSEIYFTFAPSIDRTLDNTSKVQLGALASRTQGKSVTRSTTSPYTVTGTDSRTGESYSYTSDNGYISGGSISSTAYNYEGYDVSTSGSVGGTSYSSSLSGSVNPGSDSNGDYLHLSSSGTCTWTNSALGDNRYCSVFGPEIFSEAFYANEGQSLAFNWRATAQSDDYEIYAYLVALDSLSDTSYTVSDHTTLAHAMGNSSAYTTTTGIVPTDGYYRFRFVNGTYDGTGGKAVGSNMYVYSGVTVATTNVITFPSISDIVTSTSWTQTVQLTSSSGAEVTVADSGVCSVSTSYSSPTTTATITGTGTAGTCTLVASQGASGIYAPASNVTRTFDIRASAIAPGAPTVSSVSSGPGSLTVNFTAPNQDGGAAITNYEYQLDGGSWVALSPATTLSPFTLDGLTNGTTYSVKIRAVNSVGGGTASNAKSGTPALESQAELSIVSPSSVAAGSTISLATRGGSGSGAVTYTTTGTCSVTGSTLTPGDAGDACTVTATKAADSTYAEESSSPQTVTTTQRSQVLSFTSSVPSTPNAGDSYTVTAESSETIESLVPTFAITTGDGSECSISSTAAGSAVVDFLASGTCEITASQSGSTNVAAATSISQTIEVGSANQSITFAAISAKDYGSAPFTIEPTASSGLTVDITSSTSAVCTEDAFTVTLLSVGTCTLTATQAGNGSFAAASDVVRSFEVAAVVPGKPRISSVSSSTRALSIGFDAPASDGGSSILNYVATATPTGGGSAVTGPCADTTPPLACTIDGLANGTEYTVTVAATNAAGTGANSDASDPATPAGRANAVTGAHAIPGDGSVNLYWEPISTEGLGGGTFVRYEVYMREEGNAWPSSAAWTTGTIGSSTRSKEFTLFDDSSGNTQTVDNDKNYEFKIVVITNIITTELAGNTTLVAQSARAVPSAIRSLTVTELTSTSALVTWDEPLSDGGADITSYTIVWSDGATCGTVENRACTATGLSAGTTYTVSGIATNYVGSSASASTTFTTASNGGGGGSSGGGSGSGGDSSSGGGSSSGGVTESDSDTTAGDPDSDGVLADEPTGTPEDVSAGSSLGALLAGGERVDFVIRPNQERDGWEGIAPAFTMQADAVMPSGSPRPLAVDTSLEVPRSAFVRVRANGYQPRSRVRLFLVPAVQERTAPLLDARLASEWIFLGETTVDSAGSLIARHAVPPSARLGNYTLQVHGLSEAYGEMTVHLGIRIVDEVPDLTPGVLQRAAFYRDRTSTFSVKGRKKLNYLVNQLPSNAQAVQVMITGVSVSLDDFESNLALAGKRARKLADRLKDEGVSGDYSVNVKASFTVDAAERALRGKDTVAEREDGKPLTTVRILFQEPASAG